MVEGSLSEQRHEGSEAAEHVKMWGKSIASRGFKRLWLLFLLALSPLACSLL